jgi:hypothetical protein
VALGRLHVGRRDEPCDLAAPEFAPPQTEATVRIDADDVLSKIGALIDSLVFSPILTRGCASAASPSCPLRKSTGLVAITMRTA